MLPDYCEEVTKRLQSVDWLVHNFRSSDSVDLYNPANYLHNIKLEGAEYRASLDLNVLQYTVNCVKKKKQAEEYRNACAMLLFCQMADIRLEPALALYERINYGVGSVEEALDDLAIFRALDNTNSDFLAEYMLGNPAALRQVEPVAIDRNTIGEELTRYQRLTNWDSIYALVLGAVVTFLNRKIPPPKRIEHYLDWAIREFRLSLPCVVYAGRLYGLEPLSKMMKFKPDAPVHEKRAALSNMTWDLFIIDHYFKNWTNPDTPWEEVFFTQDNMLRSLLRLAIRIQCEEDVGPLLKHLGPQAGAKCRELIEERESRIDRVYGTDVWSPQHRADLISRLEIDLGL